MSARQEYIVEAAARDGEPHANFPHFLEVVASGVCGWGIGWKGAYDRAKRMTREEAERIVDAQRDQGVWLDVRAVKVNTWPPPQTCCDRCGHRMPRYHTMPICTPCHRLAFSILSRGATA